MNNPCPSCRQPKGARKYLCLTCWDTLPALARRHLNRRDQRAMSRLQELYRQIAEGVPLREIEVSP
ncbi:hypothetical protein ACFVGN_27295 [Streptomyces sp. NPDC057757]|uniref:hypothetical protein n=1 Tax=Streptomyces sp. NPDC057757 TaxID=3346241 RepID=UPI0036B6DA00